MVEWSTTLQVSALSQFRCHIVPGTTSMSVERSAWIPRWRQQTRGKSLCTKCLPNWKYYILYSPSAKKVFKLQKKIIRIIANIGMRDSCGEIFKNLQIMTLYSLYAYSVILSVVKISIYLLLIMKYINIILEIIKIFTRLHYWATMGCALPSAPSPSSCGDCGEWQRDTSSAYSSLSR